MSGVLAGDDYSQFKRTDAATAFGMRLALGEAVVKLKGLKEPDARDAKVALHESVENSRFLKAAGTQQLVANYFDRIIDRQASPNQAVQRFLSDIKSVSAEDILAAKAGRLADDRLGSLASSLLRSAKANLGIATLTEDFIAELKGGDIARGVSVTPSELSQDDAAKLSDMEKTFRRLDTLDAAVYRLVGDRFGNAPAVNQHIAPTNPDLEKRLGTIITAAKSLCDGGNRSDVDIRIQATQIKMAAQRLLGDANQIVRLPESISPADARSIGEETLRTVLRMRSGELGDNPSARCFLDVIEHTAAQAEYERYQEGFARDKLGYAPTEAADYARARADKLAQGPDLAGLPPAAHADAAKLIRAALAREQVLHAHVDGYADALGATAGQRALLMGKYADLADGIPEKTWQEHYQKGTGPIRDIDDLTRNARPAREEFVRKQQAAGLTAADAQAAWPAKLDQIIRGGPPPRPPSPPLQRRPSPQSAQGRPPRQNRRQARSTRR